MEPSTSTLILAQLSELSDIIAGLGLVLVIGIGLVVGLSVTRYG